MIVCASIEHDEPLKYDHGTALGTVSEPVPLAPRGKCDRADGLQFLCPTEPVYARRDRPVAG
jgi:hypothetical protein